MDDKKVVLAYSGGLDTSVILVWLLEKGFDVIACCADVGQDEDMDAVRAKALKCGASEVHIMDLKKEFVDDYIFPMFKACAIYENRYMQGTSTVRPLIAKYLVKLAREKGAAYVAHGATGKGNDQVRFELSSMVLMPGIKIIAPWKDPEFLARFAGRSDMIAYAKAHDIPIKQTAAKLYSEDDNLLHISHEAGVLEDPSLECPENVFSKTVSPESAPDAVTKMEITFKSGIPTKVKNLNDGFVVSESLAMFEYLNKVGAENGLGRVDMVENRYVGIKSRGVYETPGGAILHEAHLDIMGLTMDREVLRVQQMTALKISELIYYGYWFSPEFGVLMKTIDECQKNVDGTVTVKIYKGAVRAVARTSPKSLYNDKQASMDETGGYDQTDAKGFIKINAVRLIASAK